jgi:hypothetical protein
MKLDPGFTSHWKTERLIDELGADGVLALLRLWGKCQINREWKGLKLTPKRLAMETKWKGDENHLFRVFSDPDAAWIDMDEDGTFSLHGFEEHQKQVIHLWDAGKKGGRPKKVSPAPSSKDSSSSSSSSTYSSSYPICEPNGNHMVSMPLSLDVKESPKPPKSNATPEMIRIGKILGRRESTPWKKQELAAFKETDFIEDEITYVEAFYSATERDREPLYRRTGLLALLNHWADEVGKAKAWAKKYGRPINRPFNLTGK